MTITARRRKPFTGIAGRFGVEADESVRGLLLPVSAQAYYVSLESGHWRYWILRGDDGGEAQSFAGAVGRLLPMQAKDCYTRLNAQATGPIRNRIWERPDGLSFIYDLCDEALVERFALTCVIGEALAGCERLLSISGSHGARSEAALVHHDALPNLSVNVSLWALEAPGQSLVFFPDGVLLRRTHWQWFVPYGEIDMRLEISTHPADEATPSDVGISACGRAVTFGALHIAISDQRALIQVSNPAQARRAAVALKRLIESSPRPRVKEASQRGEERSRPKRAPRKPRRSRAAVGQIVVKSKQEQAREQQAREQQALSAKPSAKISIAAKTTSPPPSERIVLKVKPSSEAPPPDSDLDGLETPEAADEEDHGLVFSDVCPMAEPEPAREEPEARPAETLKVSDEVRSALGALLAFVAKGDDRFSPEEQRLVRRLLQLPLAFDLERAFEAITPESSWFKGALERVAALPEPKRREAYAACRAVAACGGTAPQEAERLGQIALALGVS